MTAIFSVVGRVFMWERILGKATALIKHFAAADNRIHRRIDFQNQSLAAFRQQIQRPPPITMVSQSLQNVKMLDIQILCGFPIQHQSDKSFAAVHRRKVVKFLS